MPSWNELLSSSVVGNVVGTVGLFITLVSLATAYYFYRKQRKIPRPMYYVRTVSIFDRTKNPIKDMDVLYDGAAVESLSVTHVGIWNAGTDTLDSANIDPGAPILLQLPGNEILNTIVELRTSPSLTCSVQHSGHAVRPGFNFLEPKEGFVIRIVHTGNAKGFTVAGRIKGVPAGVEKFWVGTARLIDEKPSSLFTRFAPFLFVFFAASWLLIATIEWTLEYGESGKPRDLTFYAEVVGRAFLLFLIGLLVGVLSRNLFRPRIPKSISVMGED